MKYDKHEKQKQVAKRLTEAAKLYLESDSFNEFKIKVAANGLLPKVQWLFKLYYINHNNDEGVKNLNRTAIMFSAILTFLIVVPITSIVAFLCGLSAMHIFGLTVLMSILAFWISMFLVLAFLEAVNDVVEKAICHVVREFPDLRERY